MDYYKFLNSKDIREYLIKIGYKFTPEEAAFIVHGARNISLADKHKAYRELIAMYPDHIIKKRRGDFDTQPLSEFLSKIIKIEDEYVEECKSASSDAVYSYSAYTQCLDGKMRWIEDKDLLFGSFGDCLSATDGEKVRIKKRYLGRRKIIELTMLNDGTVLSVNAEYISDGLIEAFGWFWIGIPTPFRRGDILMSTFEESDSFEQKIVVLNDMATWESKELAENGFVDCGDKPRESRRCNELDFNARDRNIKKWREYGDVSDMYLLGYMISESGDVFLDTFAPYLDYEFSTEPTNKSVLALSAFMKGEITEDLLLNAYKYHTFDSARQRMDESLFQYSKQGLAMVGINKSDAEDLEKH